MSAFEKVCLIVKETPLEGLKQRYGSKDQARFVLEQSHASFDGYERFDSIYRRTLEFIRANVPGGTRVTIVDFRYLPTYQFDPNALMITVGPDGLVANAAKYLGEQPLIAVNPDPTTIDGVLARNSPSQAIDLMRNPGMAIEQRLAMALAQLHDGQTLLAVNDLFIGQRTHVSARYEIDFQGRKEQQSSSGIIVSTGAGSTGWRRSVLTGASGIVADATHSTNEVAHRYSFPPDTRQLAFAVREPFVSRASAAGIVAGTVQENDRLIITSQMPQNGVIFSDGIESDFLEFNSGAVVRVGLAEKTVRLWSHR